MNPIGRKSAFNGPEVFLRQFQSVPTPIGNLFAVHWCQSEICNGGFAQFFTNPTGVLAPEAVLGCKAIGKPNCAELISGAMLFFGTPYTRETEERIIALEKCNVEWWNIEYFDEFKSKFYDELKTLYKSCDEYSEKIICD